VAAAGDRPRTRRTRAPLTHAAGCAARPLGRAPKHAPDPSADGRAAGCAAGSLGPAFASLGPAFAHAPTRARMRALRAVSRAVAQGVVGQWRPSAPVPVSRGRVSGSARHPAR
jgi:hypothetical protein